MAVALETKPIITKPPQKSDCPYCGGRGVVAVKSGGTGGLPSGVSVVPCKCKQGGGKELMTK